jgi:hypothetical protein
VIVEIRHRDDTNFAIYRPVLWSLLAPGVPLEEIGEDVKAETNVIRKNMIDQMYGHGMGRHTGAEVHQLGIADLTAVSDFLGDKSFFFGDTPTGVDATAYAYLAHIIDLPLDSPSTQFARGRQNLVEYCRRMRARFYSDAA